MHGAHTFVDPTPIIIDPAAQYSAIANGQAQPVGNDYKGRYNVQIRRRPFLGQLIKQSNNFITFFWTPFISLLPVISIHCDGPRTCPMLDGFLSFLANTIKPEYATLFEMLNIGSEQRRWTSNGTPTVRLPPHFISNSV